MGAGVDGVGAGVGGVGAGVGAGVGGVGGIGLAHCSHHRLFCFGSGASYHEKSIFENAKNPWPLCFLEL